MSKLIQVLQGRRKGFLVTMILGLLIGGSLWGGCARSASSPGETPGNPPASRARTFADYAGTYIGKHSNPGWTAECQIDLSGRGVLKQTHLKTGITSEDKFQLSIDGVSGFPSVNLRIQTDGDRFVVNDTSDPAAVPWIELKKLR
jgi:hypothetical protein